MDPVEERLSRIEAMLRQEEVGECFREMYKAVGEILDKTPGGGWEGHER